MSGRLLYFIQEDSKRQLYDIQLLQLSSLHEIRKDKSGYVLLECLDSNLTDGTLTRLNIDNGKFYLEVKSKQQKKLGKDQEMDN